MSADDFRVLKAVYCYFFPETRNVLREVSERIPDDLFKVTTPAIEVEERLNSMLREPIVIPRTPQGWVSLDEIHVPIIQRIVSIYSSVIPHLSDFPFSYPTSGSSEGIFHLLTNLKAQGVKKIHVLEAEYEGFGIQAANIGLEVETHSFDEALKMKEVGHWFISQPSARDGNLLPDEFIHALCENGQKITLDFAYVGTTRPHAFDVSHPNIVSAVMSFSKPYGVFRFRIGGFTFSRTEIRTLYGNKWFKDVTRLVQCLVLAERIGPLSLYPKYSPVQKEIVKEINTQHGLALLPSDSFLLAHLKPGAASNPLTLSFKRGPFHRFCLTPYYESRESVKGGENAWKTSYATR